MTLILMLIMKDSCLFFAVQKLWVESTSLDFNYWLKQKTPELDLTTKWEQAQELRTTRTFAANAYQESTQNAAAAVSMPPLLDALSLRATIASRSFLYFVLRRSEQR